MFTSSLKHFEIEEKGKKRFFAKGAFSSDHLDLVNDICTEECLESMVAQIKAGSIKLDFEHEAFRGDSNQEVEINKTRQVLGKAISAVRDGRFAEATWEFNENYKKTDTKGNIVIAFKEIKQDVERGFYDAFSIAFIPTKTIMKTIDGEKVRLLDDVRLLNVALTGNPVNTAAQIRNVFMKSMDAMTDFKKDLKNNPELGNEVEVKAEEKESGSDREKRKIRNEATAEDDEDEEEETKKYGGKKPKKKAYEKDGGHSHETDAIGEHTHPEIEKRLADDVSFLHERINDVHARFNDTADSEVPGTAIKGKSHSQENLLTTEKEVKNMEKKEKGDEVVTPEENAETPEETTPETPAETPEETPEETPAENAEPLSEVKSMLTSIGNDLKSIDARLTKLEAKDEEDVEAPESKANQKAVQSNTQSHEIQAKTAAGLNELQ